MIETLPRDARALIVFNPIAGQAESFQQELAASVEVWREHGWRVTTQPTSASGDGTRIAAAAAGEDYDLVVAAGGDGTINEVVNGLAGTRTALGTLPVGTVNVWAREIGLPLQPRVAAIALTRAAVHQIDLGRAEQRYFLLMAGVGFDAAVVAEVRSPEKRRLGIIAYALRAAKIALRYRGERVRLSLDGRRTAGRALLVVIGNSQLYGGVMRITAHAVIDDGLLDVCVIKGRTLRSAPLRALSILLRRYNTDPAIEYHRARSVLVESRHPMPVQVDGDRIGMTPMTFAVASGALRVLLPPDAPADLLRAVAHPQDSPR
jgi:YegS/Rv2252/BmrU family lipid kinase